MTPISLAMLLAALMSPVAIGLALYDGRWILKALRAGQAPPWGAFARIAALLFCHGGGLLFALKSGMWPEKLMTFWLHMFFDPGLMLYAYGLWDLFQRLNKAPRAS